ncbi:Nramp family divalent metal transporter [Stieleria sp. JC731]|uniref:Nramp family divalent metal transporter n=1 Tax=Pirellulaceae TaxID=2691357 RepID=UPI001E48AD9E|nr:Nramp family divalent metal transporter [Stieleria sp. JC731]MCC9604002.1 Nramp family divalent metal transporter [Stieleria sp. JC731]
MNEVASPSKSTWVNRIGPGLVTACVVIGPGSILTSSKVGAQAGYSNLWVIVVAVGMMMTYVTMGMRLGAVTNVSIAQLVRDHLHPAVAVVIGVTVFFIASAFQFGNNLGTQAALSSYFDSNYWPLVLNGIVLMILFGFANLYKVLERLMACFVGIMLLAFTINLAFARPSVTEVARGLVPLDGIELELPLLGLVGTTFVISAAYYQSYLARFKGWTPANLRDGVADAGLSAIIMGLISAMIMATAAAVLRHRELESVGEVADALVPLFGEKGRVIFCVGLFAAAFSSFIVNSMIGGFILSDALRWGDRPDQKAPKALTAAVLLIGMVVAMYVVMTGVRPFTAIVAAQALTVIASPLIAGTMLYLCNLRTVMGEYRNGWMLNTLAVPGFIVLVGISFYTLTQKVWPAIAG